MRIAVVGDDSIGPQARTYAEYRLFAALSRAVDTSQVEQASLVLRRARTRRHDEAVVCTVTVQFAGGEHTRLRALGAHPYAAINRAVERLRLEPWPDRRAAPARDIVATG
jgi:ribosome-associated translation inhibitor RaiA